MVRHHYLSCASCHVDPSGGTTLTEYGRAQSDVLVRWKPGAKAEASEEVDPSTRFLWAVPLPEWLLISGNIRSGLMANAPGGVRPLLMATEFRAALLMGPFVASGSLGFGYKGSGPASVVSWGDPALVSREHWLGLKFLDDSVMVRAGRLNVPFGLRNIEHTSWVRTATRTDINISQQHGAAVAFNGESGRGEVMGIAGNFQMGPDAYRERGYSAFFEIGLGESGGLGVSSLVTASLRDVALLLPNTRHAHGIFARVAPVQALALMAEVDFLMQSVPQTPLGLGFTSFLQGDVEPWQGIHIIGTFEMLKQPVAGSGLSVGGWLSAMWNVLPHTELRIDNIVRSTAGTTGGNVLSYTFLLQAHVFL